MQEFIDNFKFFEFNGSPAERNNEEDGFNETDIDIDKEKGPKKDNEKATCSKEVPIVNLAQIEIVVISNDDDKDNVCSSRETPFFKCCFEISAK